MARPIPIIDLFSGPGGFAEGFCKCLGSNGQRRYKVALSVEKSPAAYRTLRLRAFLRKFRDGPPPEYYEFVEGSSREPDWKSLYPKRWRAAEKETRCLELGNPLTSAVLWKEIRKIRKAHGGRTILLGGPPCQPYSLVGRARNTGVEGYDPSKDDRFHLYQQYVDVLASLQPAVAVMENVKGMLSSKLDGELVFPKVARELCNAGGPRNYRLFALCPRSDIRRIQKENAPADFVVRAEEHGIPQTRHRIFVVCVRSDLAQVLPDDLVPSLTAREDRVCVNDVIGTMPKLRSGLSRGDDALSWQNALRDAYLTVEQNIPEMSESDEELFRTALNLALTSANDTTPLPRWARGGIALSDQCDSNLRRWFLDKKLRALPNNETRGHMPSDLARYLFVAAFGHTFGQSPKACDFPDVLAPRHKNWTSGKFSDRYRVQLAHRPSSTVPSHIAKDGHYFIHPDPSQCRSLTVREAARLQTFPDNYMFMGNRTEQYIQVGNAVPPFLALQIAESLWKMLGHFDAVSSHADSRSSQLSTSSREDKRASTSAKAA